MKGSWAVHKKQDLVTTQSALVTPVSSSPGSLFLAEPYPEGGLLAVNLVESHSWPHLDIWSTLPIGDFPTFQSLSCFSMAGFAPSFHLASLPQMGHLAAMPWAPLEAHKNLPCWRVYVQWSRQCCKQGWFDSLQSRVFKGHKGSDV